MNNRKNVDLLMVTLFFGVLLSFTVYLGLGNLLDYSELGSSEHKGVNEQFYEDEVIENFVKICDYRLFGHIDEHEIIIGEDEWLFEAIDSENGYERLLDYIGGSPFDQSELELIADNIAKNKEKYAKDGAELLVVVIPDSMNVYSDKVPGYLGARSENTRLDLLSRHLLAVGEYSFINAIYNMRIPHKGYLTYNNTENTINSYGAYRIFDTVVSQYLEDGEYRIGLNELDFITRLTDGKNIALGAGLEKTIKNRTVSLSDGVPETYTVVANERGLVCTEHTSNDRAHTVVVECGYDWDRIQLTPYFSNTFGTVCYTDSSKTTDSAANKYGADLVVKVVRESELGSLLEW